MDGYITEKIIDALMCGSLPIYFGPKNVKKYLPELFTDAVVNGFDFTIDKLLLKLKTMTDKEYNDRIKKINNLSPSIILAFTQNAILSLILNNFFAKHNIDIKLEEGAKYLQNINNKLSQNQK